MAKHTNPSILTPWRCRSYILHISRTKANSSALFTFLRWMRFVYFSLQQQHNISQKKDEWCEASRVWAEDLDYITKPALATCFEAVWIYMVVNGYWCVCLSLFVRMCLCVYIRTQRIVYGLNVSAWDSNTSMHDKEMYRSTKYTQQKQKHHTNRQYEPSLNCYMCFFELYNVYICSMFGSFDFAAHIYCYTSRRVQFDERCSHTVVVAEHFIRFFPLL